MNELFFPALIAGVETVGIIEIVKKFWKAPKGWIYTLIMMPLAFVFSCVYFILPIWVTVGILTICICQIGYETLLDLPKQLLTKLMEKKQ